MRILNLYNADPRGVVEANALVCSLPDCSAATVRREVNGEYSLTVNLPRDARFLNELTIGRAIRATVNEAGKEQFFVIKRRSRSLTNGMTVYAEHQSYYFNGVVINGGEANTNGRVSTVFNALRTYASPGIDDIAVWTYSRSSSLRANFPARPAPITLMAALKDFMIGAAGGELKFDGYDVQYVDQIGEDNGAVYRYGANMTGLDSEDVADGYASGIYPYWGRSGDANSPLTVLDERVVPFSGTYPLQVFIPVDLTDQFETKPSQADLLAAAQEYATIHAPTGVPVSIKATRARILGDVPVDLGDTVTLTCTPWGLNQKTRVFALTFDALRGRVVDVELGRVNPGFPGAVKNMK